MRTLMSLLRMLFFSAACSGNSFTAKSRRGSPEISGGTGVRDMKARALRHVVFTLQYCLETFEQTCQCGRCDPCTKGQYDIRTAIHTVENLMEPVTCGCGHTRERSRV